MPSGQRVRFHDREHGFPVGQLGEHDEGNPRRIVSPAGFDPVLSGKR